MLGFGKSGFLSSSGASGHDNEGVGGGFEELGEDVSLFLAGADVWIVLGSILDNLFLLFEFDGEVPDGSHCEPSVLSKGEDGASKGVKSLEEVEAEISSHSQNNTLDKETSSLGHLTSGSLPSSFSHWDSGSFASSGDCGSAFLEHTRHFSLFVFNKL